MLPGLPLADTRIASREGLQSVVFLPINVSTGGGQVVMQVGRGAPGQAVVGPERMVCVAKAHVDRATLATETCMMLMGMARIAFLTSVAAIEWKIIRSGVTN